jgi:hypothetical protein
VDPVESCLWAALDGGGWQGSNLLSRFKPVAHAQLKQVVTNRMSQFFAVDSEKVAAISWLSLAH